MAAWDDEESDGGSPPPIVKKSKFDDEEEEADVADAWDAEDSDEEREKAAKKAEAEAKRQAELAASKKSKTQRIAERQAEHAAEKARLEAEEEDEDPESVRERGRQAELAADLASAGDLLGAVAAGSQNSRRVAADRSLIQHKTDTGEQVMLDLADLPLFQPKLKTEFDEIKNKLVPLFVNMQKKGHYPIFLQEFFRETSKGLNSEQIKKISSSLTTLANERMREEKAADTKGKKTSKSKVKATVTLGGAGAGKSHTADTTNYDNEIDDYDDFM
ncbi:Translation initiation factor 3 subunit J component [Orbilia oligospora]|uniref:Eukaryotic translation initiation factor 3 subunit J n=1 Tax=Orbilia oligospora TaxID=2813651 RepID=A0A7C8JG86_ORBOL|nr:Translation initiation factor 3 subunit J component [Orbilia oligospora]KAF3114647.1 Translation initiation factor 3 subunit J component [Orbilia oligospora]KAF3114926.1 Translation initiation factor 3 subunit J component [Orbilia oligospora]KAF3142048.1 Translation initiation factor 3 subunit J component [Orbilia oligospora]KAF3146504.1 Translation initiation factor 3 subunit J component [Orbilia oligospora]